MDLPFAVSPDDVLAQPTRAGLFSLLGELKRPAGTAELAERLALHPNGVRVHLERMENAGLIQRSRAPQTRGRPPAERLCRPGPGAGAGDLCTARSTARPRGYGPRHRPRAGAPPRRPRR